MGTGDMTEEPLTEKARSAVIDEFERQAAENPSKLKVRRRGDSVEVDGEIDVDTLVTVVVGVVAGGP